MLRHLVLLGLGQAHRALLDSLARRMPADLDVTLITRRHAWAEPDALLRRIALHQALGAETVQDLPSLVRRSGIRWVAEPVAAVEAARKRLHLEDGRNLRFDWLSVETEPEQIRDEVERQMPGARSNGLFLHPLDDLARLWPRVQQLADSRPLRFAVTSSPASPAGTVQAMEWSFTLREAWPQSAVTWVAGADALAWASPAMRDALRRLLSRHRITLLEDVACRVEPDELHLASGARLACDVPLLAGPCQPAAWLAASDLALDSAGHASAVSGFEHVLVTPWQHSDRARRITSDVRRLLQGQPPSRSQAPALHPANVRTGSRTALVEAFGMTWGQSWLGGRVANALLRR
ncbi:MAG: hypothetical protein RLZZ126_698 [Pseudomonadota bacterium]|jgi:hypothetical protein